jgi:hypothetical protein
MVHSQIQSHLENGNVDTFINEFISSLAIRTNEKDRFGEVFTPLDIINAMLDKLPQDVWFDPTKKWLDPAAGFGNFFMVVYARLMVGLSEHPYFKDKHADERSQHIIERMFYMVEYNPENCDKIREIFGPRANLFCGSFLEPAGPTFADKTTEFDIIIGNPPFNADQKYEGKKGGGSNLWPKFVEKILNSPSSNILIPEGYLVFVHPALWRKPSSDCLFVGTLFDKMTHENHMLYLEIHSKMDGVKHFGVQTRYDFYVIQKRPPTQERGYLTQVKDQNGTFHEAMDLSKWRFFLPNHSFDIIKSLLVDENVSPETENADSNVIFSRCQYGSDQHWIRNIQDDQHIYPVIHSTPKSGPRIMWSSKGKFSMLTTQGGESERVPMFGIPKVIFGESGINDVILDIDGKYGMTQGAIGLKIIQDSNDSNSTIKDEGMAMKKVLESREFYTILDAMSFSNFRIDWRMFLYFRGDFYKKVLVT